MSARRELRRQLGAAAVISETEAASWLPCRDEVARQWLRDEGLVRVTPLGRVVVWGEVLDALTRSAPAEAPRVRRPPTTLPRVKIPRR